MKVVILAGGMGTRISEESHLRPKPMIEIGGSPILWHIMKGYSHYGFHDFVICCGYKGYMIKEYFSDYYLHRSDITFDFAKDNEMIVHNNVAEPWRVTLVDTGLKTQTGGRIARIRRFLDEETFLLTYGDGVSNVDLPGLLSQHRDSGKIVTITGVQPAGRYGVLETDDAEATTVLSFREKSTEDVGWINAGFMAMEPGVFDYLGGDECYFEREPMQDLARDRKLGVYRHMDFWKCMDTQRDKNELEKLWDTDQAPWRVW